MLKSLREYQEFKEARETSLDELTAQVKVYKEELKNLESDRLDALADADDKALEKADKAIAAMKRKIEIAEYQQKHKQSYDPQQSAALAEKIRKEATKELEAKRKKDEAIRQAILDAKQAYLTKVAEHAALATESRVLVSEVNEALKPLELSVEREAESYAEQGRLIDRRIYELSPSAGFISDAEEARLEELWTKKGEAVRTAAKLREQVKPILNGIRELKEHSLSGAGNPYLIHSDDQHNAMKGEVKAPEQASGGSAFGADMRKRGK
ncbi:Cdc6-like AAA superfamily ATPase [Pullulanibacillus pueri]|nr:Cdc6-like AAA superfamily ATPase [Pullulanibacillus pueri]